MNNQRKNEKGFTMIELIVVVAIMGIIGALLVPAFGKMAAKAKLTTDITTVKTLQHQLDVYRVQESTDPLSGVAPTSTSSIALPDAVVTSLVTGGYLDEKDLKKVASDYQVQLQSGGIVHVALVNGQKALKLDFSTTTANSVTQYINTSVQSTDPLAGWISGVTFYAP